MELYDRLNKVYHFDLDPCTTEDNPLNAPCIITKEKDGLKTPWFGNVFCNPPYNEIPKWLKKGIDEIENNPKIKNIVYLLPARTDTKHFHDYIYANPKHKPIIHFLRGRLKFRGAKNSAPFPSMLVIFSRK